MDVHLLHGAAVGFVVIDLGQPLRLWELFAYSNLGSPLMWDIAVISIYLILSVVYLWATLRAEAGKVSEKALRVISVIALVTAVLVHSVTAWIFGLQQAHEFWHTALLGALVRVLGAGVRRGAGARGGHRAAQGRVPRARSGQRRQARQMLARSSSSTCTSSDATC